SFDEEPAFDDGPSFDDEPTSDDGASEYPDEGRKKRGPLALIVLIILILAILGLGALLIIRGMSSDSIPPLEADNNPTVTEPEDLQPAEPEPEPIIIAEAEPEPPAQEEAEPVDEVGVEMESPAAVSYDTVPPAGHGGGVWYRLKWGDTLWDLSSSFYRTPWLYGLIAVENGIKNPDIIYAGTDILIPEN
ncbi:MAG TPA: hypothetical protein DCO79_05590, partial [Spirochaeta sp.]|nr:hypothetical protein [Spirochaeta sp.]